FDLAALFLRRTSGAAIAEGGRRDVHFLLRRLVDVHRTRGLFRALRLRKSGDDDATEVRPEEELDDVAFLHDGRRFHPQPVDLHLPAAARLGRVRAMLEEADVLEPVIDAMSHTCFERSRETNDGAALKNAASRACGTRRAAPSMVPRLRSGLLRCRSI